MQCARCTEVHVYSSTGELPQCQLSPSDGIKILFSASLPEAVLSPPTGLLAGRRLLPAISLATPFHNLIPHQNRPKLRPQSYSLSAKRCLLTAGKILFSTSLPEAVLSPPTNLLAGRHLLPAISLAAPVPNRIPLRLQSCTLRAKRRLLTASPLYFQKPFSHLPRVFWLVDACSQRSPSPRLSTI